MPDERTFVFDAQPDGRRYSGEILGVFRWEGKFVAVQKISPEMAVLHRFETMPEGLTVGEKAILSRSRDGGASIVAEHKRDKETFRGR
jgi:hypothetical protein